MKYLINKLRGLLKITESRPPQIGEKRQFSPSCSGPWPKGGGHWVEVLDVKDGWVRYKFSGSSMWQDERMWLGLFDHCYPKPKNAAK